MAWYYQVPICEYGDYFIDYGYSLFGGSSWEVKYKILTERVNYVLRSRPRVYFF